MEFSKAREWLQSLPFKLNSEPIIFLSMGHQTYLFSVKTAIMTKAKFQNALRCGKPVSGGARL